MENSKITELEERIKAITKEVEDLKKQETNFEVGKWYTNGDSFCNYQGEKGFGLNKFKVWIENNTWIQNGCNGKWNLATEQEVSSALIEEAKIRYKEGDIVFSFVHNKNLKINSIAPTLGYIPMFDKLHFGIDSGHIVVVYEKGKWAEIIKEEKITIGGYEVKFHNLDTEKALSTIDGHLFTYEFWNAALVISKNSKAKIMIGCSKQFDVSIDVINKILDKLK